MPAATIVEVGPRDGLQSHDAEVPTDRKVALVERLVAAGLTEIEATSFAHPKMVAHLADGAEVMAALERRDGVRYRALVPNHKGAERAIAAGVDAIVAFISASATYSERNQNMTTEQALAQLADIAGAAQRAGVGWIAGISMAFGSPYEPEIPPDTVFALVEQCAALGPEALYVADTVGAAPPDEVRAMCEAIRRGWPGLTLAVHLHTPTPAAWRARSRRSMPARRRSRPRSAASAARSCARPGPTRSATSRPRPSSPPSPRSGSRPASTRTPSPPRPATSPRCSGCRTARASGRCRRPARSARWPESDRGAVAAADPPDDALLSAAEVAAWLDVDEAWLANAIAEDALPVMGYTNDGRPVVAAGEVRAWLRRPDPHGDET